MRNYYKIGATGLDRHYLNSKLTNFQSKKERTLFAHFTSTKKFMKHKT